MDAADLALVVLSVTALIGVVGLLFALGSVMRTMAVFRRSVEDVTATALPLIADMHAAVRQTNADLVKVDALIDAAESISTRVDSASRLAFTAFSSPVVKLLALWAGTVRAIGGFRSRRPRGVPSGNGRAPTRSVRPGPVRGLPRPRRALER
jgi:hypothetical protein